MSRPATGAGRGAGAVGRVATSAGKKAGGGRGTSAGRGEADRDPGANADGKGRERAGTNTGASAGTALQRCVRDELRRHFALLDGEPPSDLYRLVMQQVEASLIDSVLKECGGNRSQAAVWLGISRGTLRGKLADHDSD